MWGKQDFALPWFAGFEALSAPSWSMSSTNMSHCVGSACCCLLLATASFFHSANFPRHAPQFHWWPLLRDPIRPRPPTAEPGTAAPWTALMGPHHGMVSSKTHRTHNTRSSWLWEQFNVTTKWSPTTTKTMNAEGLQLSPLGRDIYGETRYLGEIWLMRESVKDS